MSEMLPSLMLFSLFIIRTSYSAQEILNGTLCNVAHKKKTYSSSTYNDQYEKNEPVGYSCNAVDGLSSQDYFNGSCMHTRPEKNPWFTVDLGEIYNIQYINLSVRTDNPQFLSYQKAGNIVIDVDNYRCVLYNGPTTEMNSSISFPCVTRGRKITITRFIEEVDYLSFCEIQVFALIYNDSCPLPPTSWHCPELPHVTTDQEISTTNSVHSSSTSNEQTTTPSTYTLDLSPERGSSATPVFNTASTDTTLYETKSTDKWLYNSNFPTAVPTTTNNCVCSCSNNFHNMTTDQIMERLEKIIADIQVNPKLTSRALRKLNCAGDDRKSARNVGLVGVSVLVAFVVIIMLFDCSRLITK